MVIDSPAFTPTPERAARLLADLDSPDLSFRDLAEKHGTNSNALAVWLAGPAARDHAERNLDAVALRARIVAGSLLPSALKALSSILENHRDAIVSQPRRGSQSNAQAPATAVAAPADQAPDEFARQVQQRRRDETTRRAAYLVFRLANFFPPYRPTPRAARPAEMSSPAPQAEPTSSASRAHPGSAANGSAPHASPVLTPPSPRPPGSGREPLRGGRGGEGRSPSVVSRPVPTVPDLSAPILSSAELLADSHPDLPRHLITPRAPALVLARSGSCVGAGP